MCTSKFAFSIPDLNNFEIIIGYKIVHMCVYLYIMCICMGLPINIHMNISNANLDFQNHLNQPGENVQKCIQIWLPVKFYILIHHIFLILRCNLT